MEYQKPDYSMSFDDEQGKVGKGTDADLHELTKKVLHSLQPVIGELPDTYVKLPAGIIVDGKLYNEAEVQELNGEHEEKIAKARTMSAIKYLNTLLLCGTVAVGSTPISQSLLDSMIQGDLDMLMLGIRRATFGDTFEVFGVPCPTCDEKMDLTMDLKDIPVKSMEDPEEREFIVDLRKGRKAKIQFPTGSVQAEIFKQQYTVPEMNSISLAACVISFFEVDGSERMSTGLADIKKMSVGDRNILQAYIYDNQPGPRYDQVVAKCGSCEGEVPVPLNVGILFREL